jgi:predicted MFS family arabinose efflux permease
MISSSPSASSAPLYWMGLGAFAIGTEGFMIAGILPAVARDLSTTLATAGQLVTIFALAYAVSSPVLTALTSHFNRRTLLIASMAAFAAANVIAAASHTYWMLAGARVLLALAAGLYMPGAFALASALVTPERRGRALAIVNAGITVAIALGVPLGSVIGNAFGWQATFACVAVLATIATAGLAMGLTSEMGAGMPVASLKERFAVIAQPAVLKALLMTTLWSSGTYAVYTYLAALLTASTSLLPMHFGIAFFLWGAAAAGGVFVGGIGTDRFGSVRVIFVGLPTLTVALVGLSLIARYVGLNEAIVPLLVTIVVWGVAAWAVHPAQQARLIQVAGTKVAPVALSLNASFLYLGFAAGAALGGFTLSHGSAADLGWVGGLCEIAALALMLRPNRSSVPIPLTI